MSYKNNDFHFPSQYASLQLPHLSACMWGRFLGFYRNVRWIVSLTKLDDERIDRIANFGVLFVEENISALDLKVEVETLVRQV